MWKSRCEFLLSERSKCSMHAHTQPTLRTARITLELLFCKSSENLQIKFMPHPTHWTARKRTLYFHVCNLQPASADKMQPVSSWPRAVPAAEHLSLSPRCLPHTAPVSDMFLAVTLETSANVAASTFNLGEGSRDTLGPTSLLTRGVSWWVSKGQQFVVGLSRITQSCVLRKNWWEQRGMTRAKDARFRLYTHTYFQLF